MTTKDLIDDICTKNPLLTYDQLMELLGQERQRTHGLLNDETLIRLIAAKLGVSVKQNSFQICGNITSGRLISGLYDVSLSGCLIAVFPVRTFQGEEKSGKFAILMLGDCDGLLRVVLWNEKAELVERGDLRVGQNIRFLHCYTKNDRFGKIELHMGNKSQVEIVVQEDSESFSIQRFATKICDLKNDAGVVHVVGTVKAVMGKRGFARDDNTDGVVMRLAFRDDSGEVMMVVWNEKVEEVEKLLRESPRLLLVNARVKENKGSVEIHVDSNTFVAVK